MRRTDNALRWGPHGLAVVGLVVCLLTLWDVAPRAQLAVPGPSGVVMGHLHLATTDVEASRRFWTALGGVAVQNGQLQLIQLPGTFVMLRQSQQTTGGSEGSTVDRVMLRVRTSELPQLQQKLAEATGSKLASALLKSPEGVTIELRGADVAGHVGPDGTTRLQDGGASRNARLVCEDVRGSVGFAGRCDATDLHRAAAGSVHVFQEG